jgi:hypothetical protein
MFSSVYKDGNIFGAIAGDKSFILGQNDLTFFLRTKNSLNLHWFLLFASFPGGDSIEQICQVYYKEQSLWVA